MGIENSFFKPKIITEGGMDKKTPLEQTIVSAAVTLSQIKGKEKIQDEREKTPEEIELLRQTHRYIEEEFVSLGLPAPLVLSEESFHFVSSLEVGRASMERRSVEVCPEESFNTFDFTKTLIHESIHVQSFGSFTYRSDRLAAGKPLSRYRFGYSISNNERKGVNDHEHFESFNEGVVDKMALEIATKHAREIFDVYKDSPEKIRKGTDFNRYEQISLVEDIIEGTAKQTERNPEDVWKTIKRGLFTGEMMPLRDIERVYGKGSLRVLDSSVAVPKTEEEIKQNEDVELYFWMFNSGKSTEEREKIKKKILGDSTSDESLEASIVAVEG